MRAVSFGGFGREADRVLGLRAGGDQVFEITGKIAPCANFCSNRHDLFLNHLIVQGEDLLPLGNAFVLSGKDAGDAPGDGCDQGRLLDRGSNDTGTLDRQIE